MADPKKPRAPFAPWDRRELPGAFDVDETARRVGNYKWIESERASGLYDLTSDLGESVDLSAKLPAVATDFRSRWTAWRKSMEDAEPRGPFRDF
jgi:hypothetical protein